MHRTLKAGELTAPLRFAGAWAINVPRTVLSLRFYDGNGEAVFTPTFCLN